MEKIKLKKIPKKLLIIKPSSLGDIVHSLPFLDVMKDSFPKAEIHWIIAKGLEGLLEDHPMVNKLWIINKDQWKSLKKIKGTISEVRQLFSALKKERYDITVDLQGLLRSGLLTNASRASVRVGFKEAREGSSLFYTHKVKGGKEVHAVDRYLKIAAALGCEATEVRFPMPLIRESQKVQRLKADVGQYAVIVPGARWKTKIWPAERFGLLTSMLNTKSIIIGSSSDAAIAEEIETLSGGRALSMAGKTDIKELISIIRDAGLVVTNDSGPMHIAAAFSRPVVAIFGPTNPVRTGPYSSNHTIVRADIKCAPCYKKSCKDTRCMDEISVEMVYEAIKKL